MVIQEKNITISLPLRHLNLGLVHLPWTHLTRVEPRGKNPALQANNTADGEELGEVKGRALATVGNSPQFPGKEYILPIKPKLKKLKQTQKVVYHNKPAGNHNEHHVFLLAGLKQYSLVS